MKKKGFGKRIISTLLTFAMAVTSLPAGQLVSFAETTVPFTVADGLYDSTNTDTLGLSKISEAKVVEVATPNTIENDTFANGVVMTEFKGQLYCQWQSSDRDEDSSDTKIAYRVGTIDNSNDTITWNTPAYLPTTGLSVGEGNGYCSSGGWYVDNNNTDDNTDDDTLVAYINYWPASVNRGGFTYYTTSKDGVNWEDPQPLQITVDGVTSNMNAIFEQDPHVIEYNGETRIVNAAHFQNSSGTTGLYINPIYTTNTNGIDGWTKATYKNYETLTKSDDSESSREIEPSMFMNSDGDLVMIFRDQNGTDTDGDYNADIFHIFASVSTDGGEKWSDTVLMENMLDASQKQSAGNLPDGTAYIVNSPSSGETFKKRYPLVISLSKDGKEFTEAYVLRSYTDLTKTIEYQADGEAAEGGSTSKKRLGYHYPKSVVIGDYLYVTYAENKEDAEYVRIPLADISLNAEKTINGILIDSVVVKNIGAEDVITDKTAYYDSWSIDTDLQLNDIAFGDRAGFSFMEIDERLVNPELIMTACDAKKITNTEVALAEVKAADKDILLSIGFDARLGTIPAWVKDAGFVLMGDYSCKLNENSDGTVNERTFNIYQKKVTAGESVTLYSQGQSSYVAGYFAMASEITEDTIVPTPEPTVAPTEPPVVDLYSSYAWNYVGTTAAYDMKYKMDTKSEYIITENNSLNGTRSSLVYSNGTLGVEAIELKKVNGEYTLSNIDAANNWSLTADGKIYCSIEENGTTTEYYLTVGEGNTLTLSDSDANALSWVVGKDISGAYLKTTIEGTDYYLNAGSSGYSLTTELSHVILWSKSGDAYAGPQAALTGTLNYSDATPSSLTEDSIKEGLKIYYRNNYGEAPGDAITWDSSSQKWSIDGHDITVQWANGETVIDNFDPTVEGNYTMSVLFDGVKLGEVEVLLYHTNWKDWGDITETTYYERVQSMDNTDGYVITNAHINNDDRAYIDRAGTVPNTYYSLAWNGDVNSTAEAHKIASINVDGEDYFTIENVDENNLWLYDESNGYIYSQSGSTTYYLNNVSGQVSFSTTSSSAGQWSINRFTYSSATGTVYGLDGTAITNDGTTEIPDAVEIYTKGTYGNDDYQTHKGVHLRFRIDPGYFEAQKKADSDALYIYKKVGTVVTSSTEKIALVSNPPKYNEIWGMTTITQEQVLANAVIYHQDENGNVEAIPLTDERVTYYWTKEGGTLEDGWRLNPNEEGKFKLNVSFNGKFVDTINVKIGKEATGYEELSLTGNEDIIQTAIGNYPDFSGIKYYTEIGNLDSTVSEVTLTAENGLEMVCDNYDPNTPDDYVFKIYKVLYYLENGKYVKELQPVTINGEEQSVTVRVVDDPYLGLDDATTEIQHPEPGAVRIEKDAVNDSANIWENTGVTNVELKVAGTSHNSGFDVVLVVDLSNSMGRFYDENETDPTKRQAGKKLKDAMDASKDIANLILGENGTDITVNNTLSFVTFGGYDKEHAVVQDEYYDVTKTVFLAEQNYANAYKSFDNTKFLGYGSVETPMISNGITYENGCVQIADINGNPIDSPHKEDGGVTTPIYNAGGTNYDYAFYEATQAVKKLHQSYGNYEETGRETIVIFMTDGAPTYYNGIKVTGALDLYLPGTEVKYPKVDGDLFPTDKTETAYRIKSENWYNCISRANVYAEELGELTDSFYAIAFDTANDKTSSHCYEWSEEEEYTDVLSILAGREVNGETVVDDVLFCNDDLANGIDGGEILKQAFAKVASELQTAGTKGIVTDIINEEFKLHISETITNLKDETSTGVKPTIEVRTYELYTQDDVNAGTVNDAQIGDRNENSLKVLESVEFKIDENGNITAYSSLDKTTDIYYDASELQAEDPNNTNKIEIRANYFTYTMDANGKETFEWNIGDIGDYEYILSYYAFLKGADEGTVDTTKTTHYTNEEATLTYIDINNEKATKIFDMPNRPWGSGQTVVEFYLVNKEGQYVNYSGDIITNFEDRIKVTVPAEYADKLITQIPYNTSETISVNDYSGYLDSRFEIYDSNASYTVKINSQGYGDGSLTIGETGLTQTTVWVNEDECNIGSGEYNTTSTIVAFAVMLTDKVPVNPPLNKDKVVIDYGKQIEIDVIANNPGLKAVDGEYTADVVGFYTYDPSPNYTDYIQTIVGLEEVYDGEYGTFTISEDTENSYHHKVVYTPDKFVNEVEQVFTVVKITNTKSGNDMDYWYLYQELDVIPATVVYYETDFASDAFTNDTSSGWVTDKTDAQTSTTVTSNEISSDNVQQTVEIGTDLYGYDKSYEDDNMLSDGKSFFVEGKGANATTSTFTFKGTGFDIISRTGASDGMIRVQVFKTDGTKVKTISVLNKAESSWGELYQIPVISIEDLTYDTYNVVVGVYQAAEYTGAASVLNRGDDFYFDSVRVYNPLGKASSDGSLPGDTASIGLEAYNSDGEYDPDINEVRDLLIGSESFTTDGISVNGAVFLDRFDNNENNSTDTTDTHNYEIKDYEEIGPNNETYLAPGQAIAFKLENINGNIASIDIGAKSVEGSTVTLKATIANTTENITTATNNGNVYTMTSDISSSTSQYFQLYGSQLTDGLTSFAVNSDTSTGYAYVYITNSTDATYDDKAEAATNVLSITDIKVAYGNENLLSSAEVEYTATASLVDFADACYVLTPDYDVESAAFSEDETRVFGNADMVVETSQFVDRLEVTDRFGRPVTVNTSYVDSYDGTRIWTITMLMTKLGDQKYTITGYGSDGVAGEVSEATITVSTNKEGGWQDAKSIFKTLFNCRILSIKRSSGSKLFSGR